jgi:hypothetical protein
MDPISPYASSLSPASPATPAPDVVGVETTPRPTARTVGAPFSEVLAGSARAFVRTAGAAMRSLPGSPLMAVAIRGGSNLSAQIAPSPGGTGVAGDPAIPFGNGSLPVAGAGGGMGSSPTGTSSGTAVDGSAAGTNDPSIASTLAQDQEMNLYYLQVQEQVNAQNRTYSALSNVIEVEHNTAKTAIGNIH